MYGLNALQNSRNSALSMQKFFHTSSGDNPEIKFAHHMSDLPVFTQTDRDFLLNLLIFIAFSFFNIKLCLSNKIQACRLHIFCTNRGNKSNHSIEMLKHAKG